MQRAAVRCRAVIRYASGLLAPGKTIFDTSLLSSDGYQYCIKMAWRVVVYSFCYALFCRLAVEIVRISWAIWLFSFPLLPFLSFVWFSELPGCGLIGERRFYAAGYRATLARRGTAAQKLVA